MGEGHGCHECTRAHCPGRLAFGLANRISRRDYLHQHDPHLALGGDCGIDQRGGRHTPFEIAAVSLRSIQTRRVRNGAEQSSLRPEPPRSQPELGSARPRSGCRDGTNLRIFGSGYHRNARKQSERGVPANLIVSLRGDRPANGRFRNSHRARGSSLSVSRQRGSDDRMPKERSEKSNHKNPKDKTPLVESEGVSSWEVSRSGSLMRNYSVARQRANLTRH